MLFSAPMVRALLAGTKTQTRRIIKPRGHASLFGGEWTDEYVLDPGNTEWRAQEVRIAKGDRIWVKETWCDANSDNGPVLCYRADLNRRLLPYTGPDEGIGPSFDYDKYPGNWCEWAEDLENGATGWRPSIYMPRWASRLTLHVTDVRVQRLQDISEEDAGAEGIYARFAPDLGHDVYSFERAGDPAGPKSRVAKPAGWSKATHAYGALWRKINGETSWDANPWVIAYTFTVEQANIGSAREA